jgi:hypothetical protein
MGAVLKADSEANMSDLPISVSQHIESEAARQAVCEVPTEVRELGGTQEQAIAVAEAMRLILIGHPEKATHALTRAGFAMPVVQGLMPRLIAGLRRAA